MRVLLADDQSKVRSASRLLLEQEPGDKRRDLPNSIRVKVAPGANPPGK